MFQIAAFIAEPVMGAGGVIPPPATYFEKVNFPFYRSKPHYGNNYICTSIIFQEQGLIIWIGISESVFCYSVAEPPFSTP